MTSEPTPCAGCHHFRGSHIGEGGGCIVERISGPPSPDDSVPTAADRHPGRIVEVCACKRFV